MLSFLTWRAWAANEELRDVKQYDVSDGSAGCVLHLRGKGWCAKLLSSLTTQFALVDDENVFQFMMS